MISAIGVMVGLYIMTRSASMAGSKGEYAEGTIVKVLAAITFIVSALCTLYLFFGGAPTPTALR